MRWKWNQKGKAKYSLRDNKKGQEWNLDSDELKKSKVQQVIRQELYKYQPICSSNNKHEWTRTGFRLHFATGTGKQ